ncbi:MAG: alkaline phosphatase family protein [Firmicutes bacterium]|nr:alkaline phosphatase family protein [Bacillota bacterium]
MNFPHFRSLLNLRRATAGPRPVEESLRRQDRRVGWIVQAARDAGIADRTIFAVIGDHGFADAPWAIHLNVALRQAGLLRLSSDGKVADWQAFAICEGGVANVYVRDPQNPTLLERVRQVLDKLKADPRSGIDAVRTGQEAQQLFGASPLPAFCVEARPGYSLEPGVQGDLVTRAQGHPGTHGFRPDLPGYRTLFIAAGPGIAQNRTLPEIRLIDEAPTLCRPFGLVMPDAQDVVVTAALAQDEAAAR